MPSEILKEGTETWESLQGAKLFVIPQPSGYVAVVLTGKEKGSLIVRQAVCPNREQDVTSWLPSLLGELL